MTHWKTLLSTDYSYLENSPSSLASYSYIAGVAMGSYMHSELCNKIVTIMYMLMQLFTLVDHYFDISIVKYALAYTMIICKH